MKLKIPSNIRKDKIHFRLHDMKKQKREAFRLARQIELESKHFRINFINNKYCIYKENGKYEKKKKQNKKSTTNFKR